MAGVSTPWQRATDLIIRESEDCLIRLNQTILRIHTQVAYSRRLVIESELLRTPTTNPFRDQPLA